jgi:hypothetical protein
MEEDQVREGFREEGISGENFEGQIRIARQ